MNAAMKKTINTFIRENGLTFKPGRRNSDCVVICGFALYLEYNLGYIGYSEEILKEILSRKFKADSQLEQEFKNVYSYAHDNSYNNWWNNPKNTVIFSMP